MTADRDALLDLLGAVERHTGDSSTGVPDDVLAAAARARRHADRTPSAALPAGDPQYEVANGWLALRVGQHTCAGGTPESGYAHEPSCGLEPLERVEVLAPLLAPEAEERGRERGVRPFRDLFSGGPDTSCRTTYPHDGAGGTIECVEVPLVDLRAAFVEAGDPE